MTKGDDQVWFANSYGAPRMTEISKGELAPMTWPEIDAAIHRAQISFCLDKKPSFEIALVREVEAHHAAALLRNPGQAGESDAALKEAFEEGFYSASTYNDVLVNDSDAAWLESRTRAALAQAQKERT